LVVVGRKPFVPDLPSFTGSEVVLFDFGFLRMTAQQAMNVHCAEISAHGGPDVDRKDIRFIEKCSALCFILKVALHVIPCELHKLHLFLV
jgi:hypothetical protein